MQWTNGAVGNAQWTGVRLADVLKTAGVHVTARHVAFLGADRPLSSKTPLFLRSIPIEKAMHLDTLLAYGMNGEPLPPLHGAPLRVITPGWMGDACIKWLTDITLLEHEAEDYYMEKAYRYPSGPVHPGEMVLPNQMDPVTRMNVKSVIARPMGETTLAAGEVLVSGYAWSSDDRVVTQVEVSIDNGVNWQEAALVGDEVPYAWREWRFVWHEARPGGPQLESYS